MEFRKKLQNVVCIGTFALIIGGCAGQNMSSGTAVAPSQTEVAQLTTPTKNIVVTAGDLNKSYSILGEVEGTLGGKSVYAQTDNKAINDMLRKVAFTKYGAEVDAIINTQTDTGVGGGFFGALAAGYGAPIAEYTAHGIAIHFKN